MNNKSNKIYPLGGMIDKEKMMRIMEMMEKVRIMHD